MEIRFLKYALLPAFLLLGHALFLRLNTPHLSPASPETRGREAGGSPPGGGESEELPPPHPTHLRDVAPPSFENLLHKAQESLPTVDSFLGEEEIEGHHTPRAVILAGLHIGYLVEAFEQNPAYGPRILDFLHQCVLDRDIILSIRALCLFEERALSPAPLDRSLFPPRVWDLSSRL